MKILLVALALMMGSCQSGTETAPKPAAMGWSPVASWSGRANYQTDSFNIGTGQWRIKWEAKPSQSPGTGNFQVIVHSSISGRFVTVAVDHKGAGNGIAYVSEDPREFFLVVESSGIDWKMGVEEGVVGE
ncbi:MAG: hypothetical protein WA871_08165 [Candidatus Acidiferrales bacterium]